MTNTLLKKVEKHCSSKAISYHLSSDEQPAAKKLVVAGKLFFAGDYDHVMTYKKACVSEDTPKKSSKVKRDPGHEPETD